MTARVILAIIGLPIAALAFSTNPGGVAGQADNRALNNSTDPTSGFLLQEDGKLIKIDYPGPAVTCLFGINDSGQIVGNYFDSKSVSHGFLFEKGNFTPLDAPGGTTPTEP